MVLLECAMFVSKLRTQELPTVWVIHNKDKNAHLMHSVSHNLAKWAEAISDKLRVIELRERELKKRLRFADKSSTTDPVLEEEPVFPADQSDQAEDNDCIAVSYAIKMVACQLLLEITRFLRDPPEQFRGWSVNRVSTGRCNFVINDEMERKVSVSSIQSSDNDSLPGVGFMSLPSSGLAQLHNSGHMTSGRFGSTLSVEDAEAFPRRNSTDDNVGSTSPSKNRVSVYLRVNSTGGTISRSSSLKRSAKVIRVIDSPAQSRAKAPIHSRREALNVSTANALHQSLYSGNMRSARRPSVAGIMGTVTVASHHPLPAKYRRQSVGAPLYKHTSVGESDRTAPSEGHSPAIPLKTASTGGGSTLTSLRNKARKAMHTLRRRPTKSRLSSEAGPSPNSSPSGHRRKVFTQRSASYAGGSFSSRTEDHSLPCPWFGIIEHLIVVEHSNSNQVKLQHNLACKQLASALKMVYSSKYEEKNTTAKEPSMSRSISLVFTHAVSLRSMEDRESASSATHASVFSLPSDNLSRRQSSYKPNTTKRVRSMPAAVSKHSTLGSPLSSVNFSRVNSLRFSSTLMGTGDESIQLFLEAESPYPRAFLDAELDEQRREYLSSEMQGMVHAPFSILLHAAPALHSVTLSRLKPLAWDALLDRDKELSRVAGE